MSQPSTGFEDYAEGEDETPIGEYDISVIPSDFNVMTLNGLVDRGWVRIPGFQRNFVWDLGRASRLIESLVLGLPVPQLFLYEQERHKNLLIDGQQRLMSIYYFIKQRFPRPKRRAELTSTGTYRTKSYTTIRTFRTSVCAYLRAFPGRATGSRG